jgi:hypothetical protein
MKLRLGRRGEDGYLYRKELAPGDARWEDFENCTVLSFVCPCGCGSVHQVRVTHLPPGNGPEWSWNGNKEKPTLWPSLQLNSACRWHGHLVDGIFKRCGE